MSPKVKDLIKVFLFLSIGITILYIVYLRNNASYQEECITNGILPENCNLISKIANDFKSANYWWVFVALVIYMISNILRALRWHMLLRPLGYSPRLFNSLASIMCGYLANLGLPRSGEFVRAGLLSKYEGCEAEKVMGTIVLDRILDVISLLIVIGITLILSFGSFMTYFSNNQASKDKINDLANMTNLGLLVILIVGLIAAIWFFRKVILKSKFGQKITKILSGFAQGIMSIRNVENPLLFIAYSVGIWLCYFLMTYIMFFSFEATSHFSPVVGLVVFVFGTLGIVIPSPGGMGSYQYLISEALTIYGVSPSDAFSFANILFFSVQIFVNIFLGVLAFVFLPIYNQKHQSS